MTSLISLIKKILVFSITTFAFICNASIANTESNRDQLPVQETEDALSSINLISTELRLHNIERVEAINIPIDAVTAIAVTPESLEQAPMFKFNLYNLSKWAELPLESIPGTYNIGTSDFRWRLAFFNRKKTRIGTIYIDKFGKKGVVNDRLILFKDTRLLDWLQAKIYSCVEFRNNQAIQKSDPTAAKNSLITSLQTHSFMKIEIIQFRSQTVFQSLPKIDDNGLLSKLTFYEVIGFRIDQVLSNLLEWRSSQSSSSDVNVSILFYKERHDKSPAISVYLNETTAEGFLNEKHVIFEGALLEWIGDRTSCLK